MSFQVDYKKPIPTEKETRSNILITASAIGCQEQVRNIFRFYDAQLAKERNDLKAKNKIAESCILELYKLDQRLVSYLFNENGEIVVGNKVVIKLKNFTTPQ